MAENLDTKKWYIMTPRGGEPSVIVHSEYADLEGKFSRLSHAYDTKEAIFEDKNVLLEPCKLCGGVVYIWYSGDMKERLQEKNICFSCDFWESVHAEVQRKGTKKIIVEGSAYHISKDTPGDYFKGHGGRRFVIRYLATGEEVVSHNLWHDGDVPPNFKEKLPDTAEFVKQSIV